MDFRKVASGFQYHLGYWKITYKYIENGKVRAGAGELNLSAGYYSREAAIRTAIRKYQIEFPAELLEA